MTRFDCQHKKSTKIINDTPNCIIYEHHRFIGVITDNYLYMGTNRYFFFHVIEGLNSNKLSFLTRNINVIDNISQTYSQKIN